MDPVQLRMNLIMACDDGYAMQLATALRSLVETNRSNWPLEVHLLSDGFFEATKGRVHDSLPEGSALIRWIPVNLSLFQDLWTRDDVSKMTFARLLIPKVVPDNLSRILYLDTDILVLDDLKSLWETDLDGAVMGAVLDNLDPHFKSGRPGYEEAPRVQNYFNAGVLLIDLDQWRKEQISEKAMGYMTQHRQTPFMDQDALNVVCDGRWKRLDPRWNFHDHRKRISDWNGSDGPGIFHFVSVQKPWNVRVLSVNAGFYDEIRSRTCFARTPRDRLEDGLLKNWVRLKKILLRFKFFRSLWQCVRHPRLTWHGTSISDI